VSDLEKELAKIDHKARVASLRSLDQEELFKMAYWSMLNFSIIVSILGPYKCIGLTGNALDDCPKEEIELFTEGAEIASRVVDELHKAKTKYLEGN
jgi:hypothetical protein